MLVAGFQKNSFIDYPGKIASVVFLGGCNMRCHYCHNSELLKAESNKLDFQKEILPQIKEQLGFIDAVVISGGEPTMHPYIIQIIKKIKSLGQDLLIKLDTNGTNPQIVKDLVEKGLVNYIAMDVKTLIQKYDQITGVQYTAFSLEHIQESVAFIKSQYKVDYMFRTTLSPMLIEEDFHAIAELVHGAKTFQLQQFVPNDFSNSHKIVGLPYRPEQAEKFADIVRPHVGEVLLRGF